MTDGDFDCCPQLQKLIAFSTKLSAMMEASEQDDLWRRKAYQRHQSPSWPCSVISVLKSRRSILQTGLGDTFSVSGSLGLGRWHLWLQGKLKVTRWDSNEYVIAVLVRTVVVKISNSTGSEILIFYWWFNVFGPYGRESRSKWNLCILERENIIW